MLTISILLSGCIDNGSKVNATIPDKLVKINYVDNRTILNGQDFPGFELVNNVYYVSSENLSLTLEAESGHGVYEVDANATIPPGYRLYGGSETYNNSGRYLLLQYKVFDKNESLVDTINMTAEDIYIKKGYKYVSVNKSYKGTMVVVESNDTNVTGQNRIMILFGFDTVIGVVGVQDSKEKSINEALKILDIVSNRLNVRTKEVKVAKMSTIRSSNVSKTVSNGTSRTVSNNANDTVSNNESKKLY
jgi:hypothetical protein